MPLMVFTTKAWPLGSGAFDVYMRRDHVHVKERHMQDMVCRAYLQDRLVLRNYLGYGRSVPGILILECSIARLVLRWQAGSWSEGYACLINQITSVSLIFELALENSPCAPKSYKSHGFLFIKSSLVCSDVSYFDMYPQGMLNQN